MQLRTPGLREVLLTIPIVGFSQGVTSLLSSDYRAFEGTGFSRFMVFD